MGRLKEALLSYEEGVVAVIENGYDCTRDDARRIVEAPENRELVERFFMQRQMPIHCVLCIMSPVD